MTDSAIPEPEFPSPVRIIVALLLTLFLIELLLMFVLPYMVGSTATSLGNLIDASCLTVIFSPFLYRYIFRPFRNIAVDQSSLTEAILDHVVDGVVMFDEELKIHGFNSAAQVIFGCTVESVAGNGMEQILTVESAQMLRRVMAQIAAGAGGRGTADYTGRREGVADLPLEISLSRITVGGKWMYLGIIRDLTDDKSSENDLKRTLSLLHATLESTADGIFVRDLAGNAVIYNRKFVDLWNFPEELLAAGKDRLMRDHVLDQLRDPQGFLEMTNKQYQRLDEESRDTVLFNDGRVVERVSTPHMMEERIIGRVISYRDITEEKKLEHQLRHAQKMEALGTLAGGVAHDFNNILTVIMGYCNLATAQLEQSHPLRKNLSQIMTASERAAKLTNSLLAYSRKNPINPKPVNLNATVKMFHSFIKRLIGEEIELITRCSQETLHILADSSQFEQVLMNLSANARDAMSGKGCLIISTGKMEMDQEFLRLHGYGKQGTYAVVSVSDTGEGMDEATRDKVFEPFFTTKGAGRGTGLGLSIVYGIVKQHDGYINVYSERGKGTTFKIYLPLTEEEARIHESKPLCVQGGNETVLVAEDDPGVRELVKSVLLEAGYKVIEALDGEDAVAKFRELSASIDVVLMDVVMPKSNGKEAYAEMCNIRPGVAAVFMSGYTADIISKNGLVGEGVNLVAKPLSPNQLLAKLRESLAGCARS